MVVCSYYLRGTCRFGEHCRNEHPPGLEGSSNTRGGTGVFSGFGDTGRAPVFGNQTWTIIYNADTIGKDLAPGVEKPMWPLSAYGPAKGEPTYIVGIEMSPEEMRVSAYEAEASDQLDRYIQYEKTQVKQANDMFANRRRNATETYKHAVGGGTFSPSDLQQPFTSSFSTSSMLSALSGAGNSSDAVSQPSISGLGSHGSSTFGQSQRQTPALGPSSQPAPAFGKPTTSAFGQSSFGAALTSAFGATTTQPTSAFGSTGFGSAAATNPPPAFGQSAFGAAPATSAFGASTGGGFSAFSAKPAAFGASSFGQSGFAQAQNQPSQSQAPPAFSSGGGGFSAFAGFTAPTGFGQRTTSSTAAPTFGKTGFGSAPVSTFNGLTQPISAFGSHASQLQSPTLSASTGGGFSAFASKGGGFAAFASKHTTFRPSSFGDGAGGGSSVFATQSQPPPAFGSGRGGFAAFASSTPPTRFGQSTASSVSSPVFGQTGFARLAASSTPVPSASSAQTQPLTMFGTQLPQEAPSGDIGQSSPLASAVAAKSSFYPTSAEHIEDLAHRLTRPVHALVFRGGNSDVCQGHLKDLQGSREQLVAIKTLRAVRIKPGDESSTIFKRRLQREVSVWSQLRHNHIVPFIGYVIEESIPSMVAPWYKHGSVIDFIGQHPTADRTALILQSIDGVSYLHTCDPPIVHGDLKAANILVDDEGCARVGDFGLSRVLQEGHTGNTTSSGVQGTERWMAPEFFLLEGAKPTVSTDIYALVLLIMEIYTKKIPFQHLSKAQFLRAIISSVTPDRKHYHPFDPPDEIWHVFEDGWSSDPLERPSAAELRARLTLSFSKTGWQFENKGSKSVLGHPPGLGSLRNESSQDTLRGSNRPESTEVTAVSLEAAATSSDGNGPVPDLRTNASISLTSVVIPAINSHVTESLFDSLDHQLSCDECNEPIIGVRYQCLNCPSVPKAYSLCSACEDISFLAHPFLHIFVKLNRRVDHPISSPSPLFPIIYKEPSSNKYSDLHFDFDTLVHQQVICDSCMSQIEGAWYKCLHCLVDMCNRHEVHNENHCCIVLKAHVEMENLGRIWDPPYHSWDLIRQAYDNSSIANS